MNLPGPGKGKSKSDMPCKPGKQCATSGTSKVEGTGKVSMKEAQKQRLKKQRAADEEDEDYRKKNSGKVVPKFKTNAEYRNGGMIGKTHSKNNRTAGDSGYCNR